MSKPKLYIIIPALIVLAIITIAGASWLAQTQLNKGKTSPQCKEVTGQSHTVTIHDNQATPEKIAAVQCDTLTITNQDDLVRVMAFGVHDAHVPYDGITTKPLKKNQSFTVRLEQTGNFLVHDHNDEEVGAAFTVKAR